MSAPSRYCWHTKNAEPVAHPSNGSHTTRGPSTASMTAPASVARTADPRAAWRMFRPALATVQSSIRETERSSSTSGLSKGSGTNESTWYQAGRRCSYAPIVVWP